MFSIVPQVQVSDTTADATSIAAGYIKIKRPLLQPLNIIRIIVK